jgi:hypothetical protein
MAHDCRVVWACKRGRPSSSKQHGRALQYASAELKGDREIVMEAVKQAGSALEYASAGGHRRSQSGSNQGEIKKVEGVELWSARIAPQYAPGHCRTVGGTSNGRNRVFRQVHGVVARAGITTATAVSSPAGLAVRLAGTRI